MESLPPPRQRQNMNTVPFVNRLQLSNQAHMCLYVRLSVCVCVCERTLAQVSFGMLAEELECHPVCVCAHVCGG